MKSKFKGKILQVYATHIRYMEYSNSIWVFYIQTYSSHVLKESLV